MLNEKLVQRRKCVSSCADTRRDRAKPRFISRWSGCPGLDGVGSFPPTSQSVVVPSCSRGAMLAFSMPVILAAILAGKGRAAREAGPVRGEALHEMGGGLDPPTPPVHTIGSIARGRRRAHVGSSFLRQSSNEDCVSTGSIAAARIRTDEIGLTTILSAGRPRSTSSRRARPSGPSQSPFTDRDLRAVPSATSTT
jgi:hypothetical protein